jgi:hypothetical protein
VVSNDPAKRQAGVAQVRWPVSRKRQPVLPSGGSISRLSVIGGSGDAHGWGGLRRFGDEPLTAMVLNGQVQALPGPVGGSFPGLRILAGSRVALMACRISTPRSPVSVLIQGGSDDPQGRQALLELRVPDCGWDNRPARRPHRLACLSAIPHLRLVPKVAHRHRLRRCPRPRPVKRATERSILPAPNLGTTRGRRRHDGCLTVSEVGK